MARQSSRDRWRIAGRAAWEEISDRRSVQVLLFAATAGPVLAGIGFNQPWLTALTAVAMLGAGWIAAYHLARRPEFALEIEGTRVMERDGGFDLEIEVRNRGPLGRFRATVEAPVTGIPDDDYGWFHLRWERNTTPEPALRDVARDELARIQAIWVTKGSQDVLAGTRFGQWRFLHPITHRQEERNEQYKKFPSAPKMLRFHLKLVDMATGEQLRARFEASHNLEGLTFREIPEDER